MCPTKNFRVKHLTIDLSKHRLYHDQFCSKNSKTYADYFFSTILIVQSYLINILNIMRTVYKKIIINHLIEIKFQLRNYLFTCVYKRNRKCI